MAGNVTAPVNGRGGDDETFAFIRDLGQTLLDWSWEGTVGIENRIQRSAAAFGHEATTVVTAENAIIQMGDHDAILKSVPAIPPLASLDDLKALLVDVETHAVTAGVARRRLRALRDTGPVYLPRVRIVDSMLLASAFAVDLVGTWEACFVALVTGAISGFFLVLAGRGVGWALVASPLFGAFFVSLAVLIAHDVGLLNQSPGLLLIPALFVFIPGDAITVQAIELIEGRWTPAVSRLYYAIMLLAFLAIGAFLALSITGGAHDLLNPGRGGEAFPWWAVYPGHIVFAVGVALTFQMRSWDIPLAVLVTLAVSAIAQVCAVLFGAVAGTFLGAVAMTLIAYYVARSPYRAPAYVWLLTPFFTLTPGSHGLRSVESLIGDRAGAAAVQADSLVINLVTLALGIVVGIALAKPWTRLLPEGGTGDAP